MKSLLKKLAICFLLNIIFFTSALSQSLDYIVAVVDNSVITKNELEEKVELLEKQLKQKNMVLPKHQDFIKQVLTHLIDEKLQLALASDLGITVDAHTLDQTLIQLAEKDNKTLAEFRLSLEKNGQDYEQFRNEIRKEVIIARLQQRQVGTNIVITNKEVANKVLQLQDKQTEQMQYQLQHILISTSANPTSEEIITAKNKVKEIIAKLNQGEDFASIAISYSQGQQALNGGDLGWRKKSELPSLFIDIIPKSKEGDIIGPIRNSSGFHIVKLNAKKLDQNQEILVTEDKQKEIARQELFHHKLQEGIEHWVSQLRSRAHIEIREKL